MKKRLLLGALLLVAVIGCKDGKAIFDRKMKLSEESTEILKKNLSDCNKLGKAYGDWREKNLERRQKNDKEWLSLSESTRKELIAKHGGKAWKQQTHVIVRAALRCNAAMKQALKRGRTNK